MHHLKPLPEFTIEVIYNKERPQLSRHSRFNQSLRHSWIPKPATSKRVISAVRYVDKER